jgi:hypothetical protein
MMERIESIFFILTFIVGMIGMFLSVLGFMKIMFIFIVIDFILAILTIFISCKNTDKK